MDDNILELARQKRALKLKNRVLKIIYNAYKSNKELSISDVYNKIENKNYSRIYVQIKDLEIRGDIKIEKRKVEKNNINCIVKITPLGIRHVEGDIKDSPDKKLAIYTITDKDALGI